MIRNHCSSFTKVLDQTSGTQISSAECETTFYESLPIDLSFARSMERARVSNITVHDSTYLAFAVTISSTPLGYINRNRSLYFLTRVYVIGNSYGLIRESNGRPARLA